MKETRLPEAQCLACKYKLDAATNLTGKERPTEGCITICLECGHLMAFDSDLLLRELTSDEMYAVAGDERILKIQQARSIVMKIIK